MESRSSGEPETINVWELMSGLDDDEPSTLATSVQFPAISATKYATVSTSVLVGTKLSGDAFTVLEPSKAQWQSSLNVHGSSHGRSNMMRTAENSIVNMPIYRDTYTKVDPLSPNGSSLFGSVSGSNASSFETSADNLQRSLSFKLAFNSENTGILGLEDALYSESKEASSGDFSHDVAAKLASTLRLSSESKSSSSASFSTSGKLKKWFKATKRSLKQHNDMKLGIKASVPDSQSKKSSPQQMTPHVMPTSPFGGSNRKGSGDLSDENGDSNHEFATPDSNRGCPAFYTNHNYDQDHGSPALDQNTLSETRQGNRVRRHRHSFTDGNRNKPSSEESSLPAINRPSSWELEKIVADPSDQAVLYSTNSREDINAYEDSNAVRAILISLVGAAFDEKNVSQHVHYEQELKNALNVPVVVVPTVYVRGKYAAGIDNIMQLFKKGILGSLLLETLPDHGLKPNGPCICRGGKFLICPICKGKRKLAREGEESVSCRHCIGTGLLKCPSCPKP